MIIIPFLLALSLGASGVAARPIIIKAATTAPANATSADSTDSWVSKCQTTGGGEPFPKHRPRHLLTDDFQANIASN